MAALTIEDEALIRRLQTLADRHEKSVERVIADLLAALSAPEVDALSSSPVDEAEADGAFRALAGMFDVEIPPNLLSVREALANYYRTHDDSTD